MRALVLYRPWIPGELRRRICAVECVAAHLHGFEEDSRSEVVSWFDVAHVLDSTLLPVTLCRC